MQFNPDQMVGAIGSCLCRYGINLIWTKSDADGVRVIRALFPHLQDAKMVEGAPQSYTMLTGDMSDLRALWGTKEYRDDSIARDAASLIKNGTNIVWVYSEALGLRALAKMFKKINEGKYEQPRRKLIKRSGAGRSNDLLRTYLRVDGTLADSLLESAKRANKGVLRYIMEEPDSMLLIHPGMGKITLKKVRDLIG